MNTIENKQAVLIFEDDIQLALDWKREFIKYGFDVEHAWDVDNAISLCNQKKFDVIICDVFIKDNSGKLKNEAGVTLISRLRYEMNGGPTWGKTVPILVVTGATPNFGFDVLKLIRTMGTNLTMRKPFSPSNLVERIQEIIAAKKS